MSIWIQYWDGFEINPQDGFWSLGGMFYYGSFETDGGRQGGCVKLNDTIQNCTLGGLDGQIPGYVFGFAAKADGFSQPRGLITLWTACNHGCGCGAFAHQASGMGVTGTGQLIYLKTTDVPYNVMTQQNYLGYAMRARAWTHFEVHVHDGWIKAWADGVYLGKFGEDVIDRQYLTWSCWPSGMHFPIWPIERVQLGGHSSWIRTDSPAIRFDDFYIANYPEDEDAEPPEVTTPIGDLAVKIYMTGADGSFQDWTPSEAFAHHDLVDDNPHDSDGTYVFAGEESAGDKESFTFDIPSPTGYPVCVQPIVALRKTNIGPRAIYVFQRLGSPGDLDYNFSGPIWVYTTWPSAYHYFPFNIEDWFDFSRDVNGDEWTFENLIDTEFGVEIYV